MPMNPTVVRLNGEQTDPVIGSVRLLVVKCGLFRLGFPTGLVRGVVAPGEIVPVGHGPVEGLIWREGALIPATRLRPLLGLPDGTDVAGHGVLIRSKEGILCLIVDEALDLIEVPAGSIMDLPPLVVRATGVEGLKSAASVGKLLLIADPVLLLGTEGVASLMSEAARIGGPAAGRDNGNSE